MNGAKRPGAQRWKFVCLAALFFAPLAVSFWWYYGLETVRPAKGVQHGELIDPARPLPGVALPLATGGTTHEDFLMQRWTLVFIAPGPCDASCRERLHDLRQLRLALGRDRGRVGGVLLYSGPAPPQSWLAAEHAGLIVASLDAPQAEALIAQFPLAERNALLAARQVYLVDPLGNLLMSYPADAPLRGIHEDLKRLLRLSRIG